LGNNPIHASPAEHIATPDTTFDPLEQDFTLPERWANPDKSGNLGLGWIQFRKTLPNESVAPILKEYT